MSNSGTTRQAAAQATAQTTTPTIQSVSRAASILRALRADTRGLSLGQLAAQVALPRSTVQRLVNALIEEGLVSSGNTAGGYRLGPEVLLLASAMRHDITRNLHPMLEQLAAETGETVDLAMLRNNTMIFIDQVVGTQRLRTVSAIGEAFPITMTANGKAALVLLDTEHLVQIATDEIQQLQLGKTVDDIRQEIDQVARRGYALDIDEHTVGISAAGIAFRMADGVYGVSIPAPTSRFVEKQALLVDRLTHFREQLRSALPDVSVAQPAST